MNTAAMTPLEDQIQRMVDRQAAAWDARHAEALATIALGFELLIIASASFLGLGAPPPTPDCGADLNLAREPMETRPYLAIFPGLAISFAVLAFNRFGDGSHGILDPRTADR
jgi:ABC-type dipeptide/oligopeptide/nickel transport system permease subunit